MEVGRLEFDLRNSCGVQLQVATNGLNQLCWTRAEAVLAREVVEATRLDVPAELRKRAVTGAEKDGGRQVEALGQSVIHPFDVRDVTLFVWNLGSIQNADQGPHLPHSPVSDPAQIARFQRFPFQLRRILAGVIFKQGRDLGSGAEKSEARHNSLLKAHAPVDPNQVLVFMPEIPLSMSTAFCLLFRYTSSLFAFDYGYELGADAVPGCRKPVQLWA